MIYLAEDGIKGLG